MATQYMATRLRGIKYRSGYDYGNFLIFAVPQTAPGGAVARNFPLNQTLQPHIATIATWR